MSIYALLGATGSTGSAILRQLLQSQPASTLTLNICVRSRSKLLAQHPSLLQQSSVKITIMEAGLSDAEAMEQCLKGADVIFSCAASNISIQGVTVAQDSAHAIIDALSVLKAKLADDYNPPTVIVLSSASLNARFASQHPWIAQTFLMFALHYVYADVAAGNDLYRALSSDPGDPRAELLKLILSEPGGLMDPDGTEKTGYVLSTTEASDMVSYADLGAGMVEMAERREEFWGKSVSVNGTGPLKVTWSVQLGFLRRGLWGRIWG